MKFDSLMQNDTVIMVEIETGSRIPKWRTFVFTNGNSYIAAVD